jgi:uncharacterized membrane protein YsdA (DUF1294 family)
MQLLTQMLLGYYGAVNLVALALFGVDKQLAQKGSNRISEATLLGISFIGGVFGGILGMFIFKHKTRKFGFKVAIALILFVNLAGIYCLLKYYFQMF